MWPQSSIKVKWMYAFSILILWCQSQVVLSDHSYCQPVTGVLSVTPTTWGISYSALPGLYQHVSVGIALLTAITVIYNSLTKWPSLKTSLDKLLISLQVAAVTCYPGSTPFIWPFCSSAAPYEPSASVPRSMGKIGARTPSVYHGVWYRRCSDDVGVLFYLYVCILPCFSMLTSIDHPQWYTGNLEQSITW